MNRRKFLKITGSGAAACAFGCVTRAERQRKSRPNIIYLMSDDQLEQQNLAGDPKYADVLDGLRAQCARLNRYARAR